jgi:hypothetical protein
MNRKPNEQRFAEDEDAAWSDDDASFDDDADLAFDEADFDDLTSNDWPVPSTPADASRSFGSLNKPEK